MNRGNFIKDQVIRQVLHLWINGTSDTGLAFLILRWELISFAEQEMPQEVFGRCSMEKRCCAQLWRVWDFPPACSGVISTVTREAQEIPGVTLCLMCFWPSGMKSCELGTQNSHFLCLSLPWNRRLSSQETGTRQEEHQEQFLH